MLLHIGLFSTTVHDIILTKWGGKDVNNVMLYHVSSQLVSSTVSREVINTKRRAPNFNTRPYSGRATAVYSFVVRKLN